MATNPDILYVFNEASATTIRDYSDGNSQDATGANLTNQASSGEVGNELVFNGTSSTLSTDSTVAYLNNVTGFTIYMRIKFNSNTGTDYIFEIDGLIDCTWDGTTLSSTVVNGVAGNITVTNDVTTISTGSYYDIILRLNSSNNNYRMIVNGVNQTQTSMGGSTSTASITDTLDIGYDGTGNYGAFSLNEFKLLNETAAAATLAAWIDERNGVLSDSGLIAGFNVGDIVGGDLTNTPIYGIITWVGSGADYRVYPVSDNFRNGIQIQRLGHLWDTARQYALRIQDNTTDNTPEICFYDGASSTSEIFTADTQVICFNKNGEVKSSVTKTANYTVTSQDQRIYVNSSGGAFTITLEANPSSNRVLEIIDKNGDCAAFNVTVAGNGNNIIGAANYTMSTDYEGLRLIFNGSTWNLN